MQAAQLPSRDELGRAFRGIGLLMRFDVRGLALFEPSQHGFWRSFWAAAFCLPVAIIIVAINMAETKHAAPLHYILLQALDFAIGWLLWPLVALYLLEWLGKGERYYHYMVPFNWFQIAQIVVMLPSNVLALTPIARSNGFALLWLASLLLLCGYEWFITRRALQVPAGNAAALVLIDLLLTVLLDYVTGTLR